MHRDPIRRRLGPMSQPRRSWGMTPDNYPSVEDEPLAPIEQDALAYWKRFLPQTSKALEAQGPNALPTAIRAAWWRMDYNIQLAMLQSPGLPREIAEELHRTELYPPPEPAANPDRGL